MDRSGVGEVVNSFGVDDSKATAKRIVDLESVIARQPTWQPAFDVGIIDSDGL